MLKKSLSVIIPVYNEEHSLAYVLQDSLLDLPKIIPNFEIIIVNDGSTDKTATIAREFAKKTKRIKVIRQKHSGFNKALINGINHAQKNYVAYMQGNGQDLVRDIVNCLKIMTNYDLVVGIRGKRIDYNFYRFMISYGGQFLYKFLFGINYEDVHWVYVWKTKEIKKIKLDADGGMFVLVESLIRFRRKGLKIGKATAPYRPRFAGVSKNTNVRVVYKTLCSMLRLFQEMVFRKDTL